MPSTSWTPLSFSIYILLVLLASYRKFHVCIGRSINESMALIPRALQSSAVLKLQKNAKSSSSSG